VGRLDPHAKLFILSCELKKIRIVPKNMSNFQKMHASLFKKMEESISGNVTEKIHHRRVKGCSGLKTEKWKPRFNRVNTACSIKMGAPSVWG